MIAPNKTKQSRSYPHHGSTSFASLARLSYAELQQKTQMVTVDLQSFLIILMRNPSRKLSIFLVTSVFDFRKLSIVNMVYSTA
jgi:hypothetical protein